MTGGLFAKVSKIRPSLVINATALLFAEKGVSVKAIQARCLIKIS